MKVDKVKIDASLIPHATISINVFSADLPKTIPAVSSATNELTADEINILKELATYNMPTFIEPKANTEEQREDPFN